MGRSLRAVFFVGSGVFEVIIFWCCALVCSVNDLCGRVIVVVVCRLVVVAVCY